MYAINRGNADNCHASMQEVLAQAEYKFGLPPKSGWTSASDSANGVSIRVAKSCFWFIFRHTRLVFMNLRATENSSSIKTPATVTTMSTVCTLSSQCTGRSQTEL